MPDDAFDMDDTFSPAMSADGAHVAFVGETTVAVNGEFPVVSDVVYVYDRDVDADGIDDEAGATRTAQVTTEEFTPLLPDLGDNRLHPLEFTSSADPAISGDGSTVAYGFNQFYASSTGVPLEDRRSPLPSGAPQILVTDRDPASGATLPSEVVSVAGPGDPDSVPRHGIEEFDNIAENAGQSCFFGSEGEQCSGANSVFPDISDDGRYVSFLTEAPNLIVNPAENLPGGADCGGGEGDPCDVLVVDRLAAGNAGAPQHANFAPGARADSFIDADGSIDRAVRSAVLSGDGRFVAFDTDSEYLLGYFNPSPTTGFFFPVDGNNAYDVYVREWDPVVDPSVPVAFPETPVGVTSAPLTATMSTQDFGPAPILAVEILGANAGDFVLFPEASVNCFPPLSGAPPPVAPAVPPVPAHARAHLADPCQVGVAFRPTAVGVRNATLRVTTGHPFSAPGAAAATAGPAAAFAAAVVIDIPLTGGGAGQGGFTSQPTIDLGSQIVTTTSPEGTVTVTNTGTSSFQISSIALGGANPGDFVIVGTDCVGFLLPGAVLHRAGHVHAGGAGGAVRDVDLHRHRRWSAPDRSHRAGADADADPQPGRGRTGPDGAGSGPELGAEPGRDDRDG